MESLVLIEAHAVRDTILAGLRSVAGIRAEAPAGFPDVDRARRRPYDAVFIDHDPNRGGAARRIERLRELAPQAEIVIVAEPLAARALQNDRSQMRFATILELPINVVEFFRIAARLRKRSGTKRGNASKLLN